MPRYICKLEGHYFEWSTVVDAPVTEPMTLEAFRDYYIRAYGTTSERDLNERLARVEAKGTSAHGYESFEELASYNRAGESERCLSMDVLRQWAADVAQEEEAHG